MPNRAPGNASRVRRRGVRGGAGYGVHRNREVRRHSAARMPLVRNDGVGGDEPKRALPGVAG